MNSTKKRLKRQRRSAGCAARARVFGQFAERIVRGELPAGWELLVFNSSNHWRFVAPNAAAIDWWPSTGSIWLVGSHGKESDTPNDPIDALSRAIEIAS